MKQIRLGSSSLLVPAVAVGCMRLNELDSGSLNRYIHTALDNGANFFDHADIYGGGICERNFGEVLHQDGSIRREDILLQSKFGIREDSYNCSKDYILQAVEGILRRLRTEYLDVLLIHRPDALVEPEEVAEAFDLLETSGKVRHFGVSNHKPMQMELLKKYLRQPLLVNQLQMSIPVSNMIANGMEVNMTTDGAIDRDGSVLDYSRLNDITIQTWSPFQMPDGKGSFVGSEDYPELNRELDMLAEQYQVSSTTVAAAWILRHPARMQLIAGTTKADRLREIIAACDIRLTREEWYRLYLAAGHPLP